MNASGDEAGMTLRCGYILYPEQGQAIDKVLNSVIEKIPAQYVLLVDSSGQVIFTSGKNEQTDPVALGALVASDMAAAQEMAHLTGETQNYQMILREGPQINTWLINAGSDFVLMFMVTASVPLGWARLIIRRTAELIAKIVNSQSENNTPAARLEINQDDYMDQIDKSLDDLWKM